MKPRPLTPYEVRRGAKMLRLLARTLEDISKSSTRLHRMSRVTAPLRTGATPNLTTRQIAAIERWFKAEGIEL